MLLTASIHAVSVGKRTSSRRRRPTHYTTCADPRCAAPRRSQRVVSRRAPCHRCRLRTVGVSNASALPHALRHSVFIFRAARWIELRTASAPHLRCVSAASALRQRRGSLSISEVVGSQ